ncbi:hypothetical protein [Massilia consociata]|uniref:hypothetical protein n=1 Tax=Massilia consociata TaxID=760117 RepID=UPI0036D3811C
MSRWQAKCGAAPDDARISMSCDGCGSEPNGSAHPNRKNAYGTGRGRRSRYMRAEPGVRWRSGIHQHPDAGDEKGRELAVAAADCLLRADVVFAIGYSSELIGENRIFQRTESLRKPYRLDEIIRVDECGPRAARVEVQAAYPRFKNKNRREQDLALPIRAPVRAPKAKNPAEITLRGFSYN